MEVMIVYGSVGKTKLPRLVKLNPGMNTMSLSFKPTMSLSLSGQSDNMVIFRGK